MSITLKLIDDLRAMQYTIAAGCDHKSFDDEGSLVCETCIAKAQYDEAIDDLADELIDAAEKLLRQPTASPVTSAARHAAQLDEMLRRVAEEMRDVMICSVACVHPIEGDLDRALGQVDDIDAIVARVKSEFALADEPSFARRIVDTGPKARLVDPGIVRKGLGAEQPAESAPTSDNEVLVQNVLDQIIAAEARGDIDGQKAALERALQIAMDADCCCSCQNEIRKAIAELEQNPPQSSARTKKQTWRIWLGAVGIGIEKDHMLAAGWYHEDDPSVTMNRPIWCRTPDRERALVYTSQHDVIEAIRSMQRLGYPAKADPPITITL